MKREMFNSQIRTPKEATTEALNNTVNPFELGDIQQKAHILLGRIYSMGRNDSEKSTIENVILEFKSGKINHAEALTALHTIETIKDRGDYN